VIFIVHIVGILAAIWPCGIICGVTELFQAESLTQVYSLLFIIDWIFKNRLKSHMQLVSLIIPEYFKDFHNFFDFKGNV